MTPLPIRQPVAPPLLTRRHRGPASLLVLLLAAGASAQLACGKRGDPLPPIRIIPAATSDLAVHQRGLELDLELAYPTATAAGTPLPPLALAEVFVVRQQVTVGRRLPVLQAREFSALAEPVISLRGPELANATSGDRLVIRLPLLGELPVIAPPQPEPAPTSAAAPATGEDAGATSEAIAPGDTPAEAPAAAAEAAAPAATTTKPAPAEAASEPSATAASVDEAAPAEEPSGEATAATPTTPAAAAATAPPAAPPQVAELHTYAVRLTAEGGETGPFSNLVQIIPRQPPPPPADVVATAEADAVALRWSAVEGAQGYLVYRRLAEAKAWGKALAPLGPDRTAYRDGAARYGERYVYSVAAVASTDPLIESGFSVEREVVYDDRFPPPVPTGLVALGEVQVVRLRWQPSPAGDLAGYVVFRRDHGGEWRPITPAPIAATELRDAGLASGLVYEYALLARDQVGNESERSPPVSVEVR